ncbi:hypothetical protein IMZ48_18770, partial [Candidatus Bathyarchaeota archaeon]|nr:hypothetical protein [Candidatus Bathyarchaeota archaeon]
MQFRKKYSWDEAAFSLGHDGVAAPDHPSCTCTQRPHPLPITKAAALTHHDLAFHIESIPEETDSQVLHGLNPGQDTTYYGQTAPSRPPTRNMNRSPLGRAIDLTSANIPGNPSPADDEDEDLKRALMESANEAGLDAPPPQTSGVVSGYGGSPAFGPATREQYDTDQWALVRQGTSQDQGASSVAPSARKRDPKAPVLLLNDSSSMEQRLGSILTILHEISLARNTLLQLGPQEAGYGHNGEWWTGKPIVPPHMTHANSLDEVVVCEEEVHRLLGFVESTDRSFGSSRVLSELLPNSWDQEETFFQLLCDRFGPEGMGPFMHEVRSFQIGPPDTEHGVENCTNISKMCYFKFNLAEDTYRNTTSLYDVLDYEIWKSSLEDCLHA